MIMGIKALCTGAAVATAMAFSVPAHATTYTYVGSWEVDQGPDWPSVPPAYTGQEAAALLFGGSASNYAISTVSTDPTLINFENWVSTWGGACGGIDPCGTLSADDFVVTENGFYQNPGDTSSYVNDWATGSAYTNYAFTTATPLPATWTMLIAGFVGLGFFAYRGSKKNSAAIAA